MIGPASAGEVARWEAQVAASRQEVIRANAQRNLAEIELNRLLHRPLEESFATEEAGLTSVLLLAGEPNLLTYMDDPFSFRTLRAFLVDEAYRAAPELGQFEAGISAQELALKSAQNAFWSPTLALQGTVSNLFSEGGVGTTFAPVLPPGTPDLSGLFPQANDLSWSVGLKISLPIFSGGSRWAESARASEALAELVVQRSATEERIEQRVRSALHRAGASYASIALSQDAARTAMRSLASQTRMSRASLRLPICWTRRTPRSWPTWRPPTRSMTSSSIS